MKKAYSKPDIVFENFSLSTNIAAGCEKKPSNQTDSCGVQWGHLMIFTNSMCKDQIMEGDTNFNKLCYHNPYESYNVFYS